MCALCGVSSLDFRTCYNCRLKVDIDYVWFAASYEQTMRDTLWGYKYHRQRALRWPLAYLVVSTIHLRNADVVSWVPTSPPRRRQRGYDHAELLARCVAKELALPARPLLARKGVARQVGVSRQKRWQQAQEQYTLKSGKTLTGMRVLLVDDIVTSGATLAACAHLLKAAGVGSVSAAVVAKD